MEDIKQLIKIVAGKRVDKVETLSEPQNGESSQYFDLFQAIKQGKILDDDEAARKLYGSDSNDKRYLMLKSRLREKLYNNLFFLDKKRYKNPSFKAFYECHRNLFIAKIVHNHGFWKLANDIFEKTLNKAKKYELTEVIIGCLSKIRSIIFYEYSESKLAKRNQEFEDYLEIYKTENRLQYLYEQLKLRIEKISKRRKNTNDTAFIQEVKNELKGLDIKNYDSFNIKYTYYRILFEIYRYEKKFEKGIKVCDQALSDLANYPNLFNDLRKGFFHFYEFYCYFHLKDFERGKQVAQKILQIFPRDNNNWLFFQEYYYLLAMQTRNYQNAQLIFNEMVNNPRYEQLPYVIQEKWKIYEAYLKYALLTQYQSTSTRLNQAEDPNQFKIQKFLNEVYVYHRDKKEMNVAILVIQILYYLQKDRFDDIIDRITPLRQYATRHLKTPDTYRSKKFIRMLTIMEEKAFDYSATKRMARPYFERMKKVEMNPDNNPQENLEIIPYEHLWIHILYQLKKKEESATALTA